MSRRRSTRPFLDNLAAEPDKVFPVKLGAKTINVVAEGHHLRRAQGRLPSPEHHDCKLLAGDKVLLEQEYYSVGGGFIEWKGYQPPKKNPPKYPYSTMTEVLEYTQARQHHAGAAGHGERAGDHRSRARPRSSLPRQDRRRRCTPR